MHEVTASIEMFGEVTQ